MLIIQILLLLVQHVYCCGVCVCHYKKCNWPLIGRATIDTIEEFIEVDQLDEGSISVAVGKQDELSCATLGLKLN